MESNLAHAAQDAVWILARSTAACAAGERMFYKVAAAQLRILCCDTTRRHNHGVSIALLPALFPDLTLPGLADGRPLSLPDWLEQPLGTGEAASSVRRFIRQVADQDGGAHVDPRPQHPLPPEREEWILRLAGCVLAAPQLAGWLPQE